MWPGVRCRGVLLGGHGFFDAGAHRYAGPGLAVPLQFADRVRGPLRDFDRLAGVVDRDEDRQTLQRLNGFPVGRVGGIDGDEDVHAGGAGVDQVGVQFDEFTDGDRPTTPRHTGPRRFTEAHNP